MFGKQCDDDNKDSSQLNTFELMSVRERVWDLETQTYKLLTVGGENNYVQEVIDSDVFSSLFFFFFTSNANVF